MTLVQHLIKTLCFFFLVSINFSCTKAVTESYKRSKTAVRCTSDNNDYVPSETDWKNTSPLRLQKLFLANLVWPTPIWQKEPEKVQGVTAQNLVS